VRLAFLGVRGSTAAPGPEFVRFGGHTSCIAVSHGPGEAPTLLLDAGTGLRSLGTLTGGQPFRGSLLLSHLHWDHFQGVPFCRVVDLDDARTDVYLPAQGGRTGRDLIAQQLCPPAFPITPEGLRGSWSFRAVEPGPFEAEGFAVTATEVAHKGGRTYAFRVEAGGASVGYAPDHVPSDGIRDDTLAVLAGVDVLIHDAQFLETERAIADLYGHATVADAVGLAERIGAGSVVLFHHGPNRTDTELDAITAGISTRVPVIVAYESMVLDVPGQRPIAPPAAAH
jgi:ribonuclease BN (tRNA processing enzyme)